jgi:hypothetical protein
MWVDTPGRKIQTDGSDSSSSQSCGGVGRDNALDTMIAGPFTPLPPCSREYKADAKTQ